MKPILPGATLGVLGAGQLGRMFAIAARRMGYRVHVLSPDDDTPAGQVADVEIQAAYDDLDAVRQFAQSVRVVTFEFENVPVTTAEAVAEHVPVRPAGRVLHVTQNRIREKTFLREAGFPVTPFHPVHTAAELEAAAGRLGVPAVLKTANWGYDGKGQVKLTRLDEAREAWTRLGNQPSVWEQWIDFEGELSVVVARDAAGECVHYAPSLNTHRNHILDISMAPAPVPPRICQEAIRIARDVTEALDVVGVLCVEFFVTGDGQLLINELAPRPHNSGHLTIDANVTCQFEQQVRAVCGLPLGSTEQFRPAAMANLLGDLWYGQEGQKREPDWREACALTEVKLHLYGKNEPRPGRKMGHLTALADDVEQAANRVVEARHRLCAWQPHREPSLTVPGGMR